MTRTNTAAIGRGRADDIAAEDDLVAGRWHDQRLSAEMRSIVVGGCVVSVDPSVIITTTLGSCVAVCLFDPEVRIGGMNHFLLPDARSDSVLIASRYGAAAMERLINRLMAVTGRRDRLRAKVFGGANVTPAKNDIGARNVEFVNDYLATEGIPAVGWDVGGEMPRAVRFQPVTGRAVRRLIGAVDSQRIARGEARFLARLRAAEIDGDIELF